MNVGDYVKIINAVAQYMNGERGHVTRFLPSGMAEIELDKPKAGLAGSTYWIDPSRVRVLKGGAE